MPHEEKTNAQKILGRIRKEDLSFVVWTAAFLKEQPDISLPVLRELYEHNVTPAEYKAHQEKMKRWTL